MVNRMTRISEHVVIGTHGKLKSWLNKRMLNPRTIKILVYDEADEMLKVGCLPATPRVSCERLGDQPDWAKDLLW